MGLPTNEGMVRLHVYKDTITINQNIYSSIQPTSFSLFDTYSLLMCTVIAFQNNG